MVKNYWNQLLNRRAGWSLKAAVGNLNLCFGIFFFVSYDLTLHWTSMSWLLTLLMDLVCCCFLGHKGWEKMSKHHCFHSRENLKVAELQLHQAFLLSPVVWWPCPSATCPPSQSASWTGQGEKIRPKSLLVKVKAGRLLARYWHRQNRFSLVKS